MLNTDTNENEYGTLLPGEAILLITPTSSTAFTLPFVGIMRDGQFTDSIANGTTYAGSFLPQTGSLSTLDYAAHIGDKVELWTYTSNKFLTYTNLSTGWTPSVPALGYGQGAIFITTQTNTWVQSYTTCGGD